MSSLNRALKFMIDIFDFRNIDQIVKSEIPKMNKLRFGVPTYAAGILLGLFSLFMLTTIALVFLGFVYDSLPKSYFAVTDKPSITYGFFISSIIYYGLILFPYLIIGSFLYQGLCFILIKVFGGRGDFKTQYSLTSYVTLTLGTGTLGFIAAFILGAFLPCLNIFFILVYLVAAAYLVFFVQARMMMAVHRIGYPLAFIAILVTTVFSLIAFIGVQMIVNYYGLFPDFTATFSVAGINSSSISMPQIIGYNATATNITTNGT